jgi:3',5'-cyclic-AMP phosphodiesterase
MNEIKIIQITDLHLNADKCHVAHDINTYNSAQMVINEVTKEHKNINSIIFTGDLVDDESREGYKNLSGLLAEAQDKYQIFLMPGNHDSIEEIDRLCKTKNFNNDKHFSINNWIIFMFNTKKNNSPNGILYKKEIDDLKNLLNNFPTKNFMIFLHHHPIIIESESMDKMIIENSEILINIIKDNKNIKGVCWGHVHQEITTKINKTKLFSTPSTCYQATPKSKSFTIDRSAKPGYRVIKLLDDGEIKTHVARCDI